VAEFSGSKKQYYLRTKIFPIRHVVVVKNSILEHHPWVAGSLVEAFAKAKEIGIKHVSDTRRSFFCMVRSGGKKNVDKLGQSA
jgi:hypothetical protein